MIAATFSCLTVSMTRRPRIVFGESGTPFQQVPTAIFRMKEDLHKAYPAKVEGYVLLVHSYSPNIIHI